ncbi:MAG TPA: bifunctional phosphopantothenoylcysteine decarboxylase/phosphopantothenate--cysteine ligase CoaBC [Nitrospirota bacterium]|nr:bifunctional phosphopantothenoylcysteine decarboxylase/phosphopantothenate--cysteine ligase CoaBC [Nitrospirota bacterium]
MEQRDLLFGRKILLGVSGSIAAYKAVEIVRRLRDRGAEVRVAMTKNATYFVSPLTFETLSGFPVLSEEFAREERTSIGHIDITKELDLALIAPATANIIGKIAAGIADDALTTAFMARDCPLVIAPAMNERMYRNPILRRNIDTLTDIGVKFIAPESGSLACGLIGEGRLADTDRIIRELTSLLTPKDLAGQTVLVTAGPTRESIDAVRFISNPSTGKMGYALAAAAKERGADVILISGPSQLSPPQGVKVIPVVSAGDMHTAVKEQALKSSIIIMAAAVSDFTPLQKFDRKIKKDNAPTSLQLERTVDILRELGNDKGEYLLIGFAAETDNVERNAIQKLEEKHLDMIVVNDVLQSGSGFGTDTNAVTIIDRTGKRTALPIMPKDELARIIISTIIPMVR